jgi:Mg2+/citrate symporter
MALAFVEFEKGKQSQARELILKQKQEKKRLIREKYTKKHELKKKKLIQKEKLKMTQKPPTSFNKLKIFLIIGLLLLAILGVTLGFLINYRRQSK